MINLCVTLKVVTIIKRIVKVKHFNDMTMSVMIMIKSTQKIYINSVFFVNMQCTNKN
jgi:hypothetical protein